MRRNWIKLYVDQCLRGTMVSELSAPERWIWVGLLLMAGDSNIDGKIYLRVDEGRNPIGYSDSTTSELLAVDVKTFQVAKKKLIKYEKISVNKHKVITIINWKKYQSEYERQKVYRESYKENSNVKCNSSNALELDIDKDIDKDNTSLSSESKIPNETDIKLTQLLINKILENNPKSHIISSLTEKKRATWIDDCRKLREIDKRSPEDIERIILWCQEDSFWKANILSMSKLREKFDQLWLKSNETYKASQVGKEPEREESDKQRVFYEKRLALKKSLYKKYKPDFAKAVKDGDQDVVDDIENKIKTHLTDFSQLYFKTRED